MLLSMKTLLALSICSFSVLAQANMTKSASSNDLIQAGTYRLESGPKDLCGDFSLTKSEVQKLQNTGGTKILNLGARYSFELKASKHNTASDLDPKCSFSEINERNDDKGSELSLTRINDENCAGKRVSRTVSNVAIRDGEVRLTQTPNEAEAYSCTYKRVNGKK